MIDRSQKQFQVRELASRQMALVEQNKELKEENDRWVVKLVISFFLFLFRIFSLCAWWSVPRSEIPSEFKIAPLINQDVGARPSFVSNPHNLCICARSLTKPPPSPPQKKEYQPPPYLFTNPPFIIILILRNQNARGSMSSINSHPIFNAVVHAVTNVVN